MKKTVIAGLIVAMVLSLVAYAGNGAPSGPHYNLNLIGIKAGHEKNANIGCGEGHRIFVKLGAKTGAPANTKIMLTEAPDDTTFDVLDCDGTDGTASFMLPNPTPDEPGNCTKYSVYVRALGGAGKGSAVMTTCATDPLIDEVVCSSESVYLTHTKGQAPKFDNVSKELLTMCVQICLEVDPDTGDCIRSEWRRVYLFDPALEDYFWSYDNNGLKLVQMRFYLEPSCYSDEDWACNGPA